MPRAKRICSKPGCPRTTTSSYCTEHARENERARGTREQRGYGHAHRELRNQWAPIVAAGKATCWRCTEPIQPGEPWDLGHDDDDRTQYRGPEHANRCNRASAGRRSHL